MGIWQGRCMPQGFNGSLARVRWMLKGQNFSSEWNFQKKLLNDIKKPLTDPIRFELRPQMREIHIKADVSATSITRGHCIAGLDF